MRTDKPRLMPLRDDELDAEQEAVLAPFRASNGAIAITRTMAHHPAALRAFNGLAAHVFSSASNALAPRDKEILILRTAWLCRSGYEWARHELLGLRAGVSEAEVAALKRPVDAGGWSERDAALVAMADTLITDHFVPDDLWERLSRHFDPRQCIDAIYAVGLYTTVGMFLNTMGTQLDDDVTLDPDLDFRP
jgi:alkylhydroperoxidase family enzyme